MVTLVHSSAKIHIDSPSSERKASTAIKNGGNKSSDDESSDDESIHGPH